MFGTFSGVCFITYALGEEGGKTEKRMLHERKTIDFLLLQGFSANGGRIWEDLIKMKSEYHNM